MLLRFSVENHRSIRDAQELLLTASERITPEDRRGTVFPGTGDPGGRPACCSTLWEQCFWEVQRH